MNLRVLVLRELKKEDSRFEVRAGSMSSRS